MNPLLIRAVVAIGAVVFLFFLGWHFGAKNVRADWNESKIVVAAANQAAILTAVAENEAKHAKYDEANRKAVENYEATISIKDEQITAFRNSLSATGLRVSRTICNQPTASGSATSASKPDAAGAETVALPAAITENLRDLVEDADKAIVAKDAKIEALQNLMREYGHYKIDNR